MNGILLTCNPGSSTIKLGLFKREDRKLERLGMGIIDLRRKPLGLHIVEGPEVVDIPLKASATEDFHDVIDETLDLLSRHFSLDELVAVGHRVVHGGDVFSRAALIDDATLSAIEDLVPLAPLHQPQSVRLIRAVRHLRPHLVQTASFDTAFHHAQADIVRRFALPRDLFDQGIKRYGFHGLSYQFIAGRLREIAPRLATGRVVVAHLGSGASLCALANGVSRDTSMGFSTLDGIPMATRCGALDPGVPLHLMKQRGYSPEALEDLLYHRSGLLGISGLSADTRDLLASDAAEAAEAIDLFCLRIAREIAALATTVGGLDALVFTAGIGENQPLIREKVCGHLAWLGLDLDFEANSENARRISADTSEICALVMATNEEQVIAEEALGLLAKLDGE
ncbi:acetate/propionate family kinase [Labrys portucalensis]|uniref:Acetate kinase n=1 Tax=Labrys neptuniae TaxID=376174 RepID=A0ABV6ZJ21_9HYPH